MATMTDEISLRPLSLRPGAGVNPFASFALGAGIGLKNKATSAARGEEKKKPRGEVIKYPRDFLMKFAAVYTQVPTELQINNVEILLDPSDPEREAQRALLQRVAADDADERDWRSRTPLPPTAGQQPARDAAPADPNAPKIQRATDIGRTAWAPVAPASAAAPAESTAQALRKVKGILNKLTPEKFERLLGQLVPLIASYEVLQGTIVQVFENAVVQPTFVAMYADLCSELDAALPEFEGPDGPQQFKKMLANTCQEEYEATEAARTEAQSETGDARDDAERKAKHRLLGNVRLIAELFKKGMVNDRIMVLILSDLLGSSEGQEPSEDSIEAACEVIATAGASLEENPRAKTRLDNIFTQLGRLSNSRGYAPRIRFVIRDVIDLRSQHWVARRETFTAKKLDEIRSDAQAELGIVDVAIPGLEPLPGMDSLPGIAGKRPDDMELFPAFKGADVPSSAAAAGAAAGGDFSAFLGEFVPLPDTSATAAAAAAAAETTATDAPRAPRTDLSPEDRESLAKSLFSDYLSARDAKEALASAQELVVPGFGRVLVRVGLEKAFDSMVEAEQIAIADLIVDLAVKEAIVANDIRNAVDDIIAELEDISLDVPAAPKVVGRVMGCAAARGLLVLDIAAAQIGTVEAAEPRRAFVAAALNAFKELEGEEKLKSAVKESGMDVLQLLEHDAEFEGHLEPARKFAQENGLEGL